MNRPIALVKLDGRGCIIDKTNADGDLPWRLAEGWQMIGGDWRYSLEQYVRLGRKGLYTEDGVCRFRLVAGEVVENAQ